jgi:hypothetical protein
MPAVCNEEKKKKKKKKKKARSKQSGRGRGIFHALLGVGAPDDVFAFFRRTYTYTNTNKLLAVLWL